MKTNKIKEKTSLSFGHLPLKKGEVLKNNGFTLVELLIVMAILAIMTVMAVGILNPNALVGKANDSKRKSDLTKIRIAFEEYFNDKGYFPSDSDLRQWNVVSNCDKQIPEISKYLKVWPCDPHKNVYTMVSKDNWFKAVTNLENKKDNDIPVGWYNENTYLNSGFNKDAANYGVSSTNILWYEGGGFCNEATCYSTSSCNEPVGVCVGDCYHANNDIPPVCNDPVCWVESCSR